MEVDVESGASGAESSLSPNEANGEGEDDNTPKVDPIKWSVSFYLNFFYIKNVRIIKILLQIIFF